MWWGLKLVELFENCEDPDKTLSVASDLGLHCLPVTPLGVSSLQWVNNSQVYETFVLFVVFLYSDFRSPKSIDWFVIICASLCCLKDVEEDR